MSTRMGMAELERALDAVRDSDRAHFVGPREPSLVAAAEEALGVSLPPTYRRFVTELGARRVGGREFYGAIDENFVDSSIPDGIWLTLDAGGDADAVFASNAGDASLINGICEVTGDDCYAYTAVDYVAALLAGRRRRPAASG